MGIIEELDEHFLYDLDNEDENEYLAAVDLETVNATKQIEKVTLEKANKSSEVHKQRFKNLSNASLDEIVRKAETKNTKENTEWAVRVFEGRFYFCKAVYLKTFLTKVTCTVSSFTSPLSYLLQVTYSKTSPKVHTLNGSHINNGYFLVIKNK